MSSIALGRGDVVVGVDTHKDEHVAVALDGRLAQLAIPANPGGYAELLTWSDQLGTVAVFGVEGTGSYGSGLARFPRRNGRKVVEVSRPPRKGERRLSGKSDTIDAEHAAREVLAGKAKATPKLADGIVEAIRLVKIARDSAVTAHSQAMITLKATLVTAPDELRAGLEPLTDFRLVQACAALDAEGDIAHPVVAMGHVLGSLARRWLELHEEIKVHSRHLKHLTKTAAPELVAAFGIGPDIAAEMLVTAGDNTDRIRSDAALAKLCGACPIPASSGKTHGRHRLNRGGNRQANAALYRAIIVRMHGIRPPSLASSAAPRRGSRSGRSSAASSATSPARSTACFHRRARRGTSRLPRRCLDIYRSINAVSESWFATFKNELIYTRAWPTLAGLRPAVFEYIEGWYNTRRLHGSLGYRSPAEYEATIHQETAARAA